MYLQLFIGVLFINGIACSAIKPEENVNETACNLSLDYGRPIYRLKTLLDCILVNIENQWGQFNENYQEMFEVVMVSLLQEVIKSTQDICDKKLEIDPDNLIELENKMGLPHSLQDMATPIISSVLIQARDVWCGAVNQLSHDLPQNVTMENIKYVNWTSISKNLVNNLSEKILALRPDLPIFRKKRHSSESKSVEKRRFPSSNRLVIMSMLEYVKTVIADQQRMMKNLLNGTEIVPLLTDSSKMTEDSKHQFGKILSVASGFVSAFDFKTIENTKERYLKYCDVTKKSEKIPSLEENLNIPYFVLSDYFFNVLSQKFGFDKTNIAQIDIFNDMRELPSVPTMKILLKVHDLCYQIIKELDMNVYFTTIESLIDRSIRNHPMEFCEVLTLTQTFIQDTFNPIVKKSTAEGAGGEFVTYMDQIGGWEDLKRNAASLHVAYDKDEEELASRIKQKIKRSVTQMTNKEWNEKKDEFFRKQYQIFDESSVGTHNETFQEIQKNVKGILEGFSIESGDAKTPTTLKMSKKWKPVVQRIRRASGENMTDLYYESSEDEERLSLSQDEKIVLEEALDRIISAIINHRNELMSRTRKFISLVVHILAKSEKMEPESLSCIARAGVTFMSETRKHLNTVFKGFRNELETMKNTLWSEDSIDGSDNDETLTKLISAELMRDVEDAIAASSRTYEVNKVRLFEKFMTCKIKNSAF